MTKLEEGEPIGQVPEGQVPEKSRAVRITRRDFLRYFGLMVIAGVSTGCVATLDFCVRAGGVLAAKINLENEKKGKEKTVSEMLSIVMGELNMKSVFRN